MSEDGRLRAFSTWLAKVDAFAIKIEGEDVKKLSGNGGLDTREHQLFQYAGDLLKEGGEILAASVPQKVMCVALDDVEEPESIEDRLLLAQFRLSLVLPIVCHPSFHSAMTDFFLELNTHRHGGETELFGQSTVKGHGNREPWKIAFFRMEALAYYQVGRNRGLSASDLQLKLHESFGASYDTIRKWRAYAIQVYGPELFEHSFSEKLDNWDRTFEEGIAAEKIMLAGAHYRDLWRESRK